jgi:ABC-type multidrug transport system fused ATPase/permease subunit
MVAAKRIEAYLDSPELDDPPDDVRTDALPKDGRGAVRLHGVSVRWERTAASPTLRGLDLEAAHGELVAVVGSVGSGKSSLLASALGEMHQGQGRVELRGKVGYCSQQPWLMSGTLKENILYGSPFDKNRYEQALRASCLEADLLQLPGGEETVIGERVALARAVYRDADIYLLDDVLAAVDVHVGEHLMSECICGEMEGKTRILVTNALHFLPRCDRIYVIHDGTIAESGTYDELISKPGGLLVQMGAVESPKGEQAAGDEVVALASIPPAGAAGKAAPSDEATAKTKGTLVEKEERKYGKVELRTYYRYLRSGGSDLTLLLLVGLGYLAPELCNVGSQLWLSEWSAASEVGLPTTAQTLLYQAVYAGLAFTSMGLLFGRAWNWATIVVKAAKQIHVVLLANVLRLPSSFFDVTPTGRILNRFSHDVDQIDALISRALSEQGEFTLRALMAVTVCVYLIPVIALALVPVLALYVHFGNLFRASSREIRRLDSTTRSPVYAHFGEAIVGLTTIRSFGDQTRFIEHNASMLEQNTRCRWSDALTQRWLNLRFDQVSVMLIAVACFAAVYTKGTMNGGLIGVVLVQLFSSVRSFRMTMKGYVNLEAQMTYVERIFEYIDLPTEPPASMPTDPSTSWPSSGKIVIRDVSLRYRDGLPLALDGVNLTIEPKQRVGIVGRTGSGKSTLTLALFRIVEIAGGTIEIDGVNIAKMGLTALRKGLTIIPQVNFGIAFVTFLAYMFA